MDVNEICVSISTGFIVEFQKRYFIITNAHCIKNSIEITCKTEYFSMSAIIIAKASMYDLAILSPCINKNFQFSEFFRINSEFPEINSVISMQANKLIKHGIITRSTVNFNRKLPLVEYETTIPTYSGNSGSPVFDINNKVIGILYRNHCSKSYIIPAYSLQFCLNSIVKYGYLPKTMLYSPINFIGGVESGVLITYYQCNNSSNFIISTGNILLSIDGYKIDKFGYIDLHYNFRAPFWFLLYHKRANEKIIIKKIQNNLRIQHISWIPELHKSYKITELVIGKFHFSEINYKLLKNKDEMLQEFMKMNLGKVMVTQSPAPCRFQIAIEFNGIPIINIMHLNHLYIFDLNPVMKIKLTRSELYIDR